MGKTRRLPRVATRARSRRGLGELTDPNPGLADPITLFGTPHIVMQPIISVSTGAVLAVEALARFDDSGGAGTEEIFEAAHVTGHGAALEAACLHAALRLRGVLPKGILLSVNVSPNVLQYLDMAQFWPDELQGVIVEITEQDSDSPIDLGQHLVDLRERGAAIAIDDVSTGYAGLMRLAQLRPDYVKVDRQVVAGVGESFTQAAVLEALVTFSHRLGAAVIGEGVEDLADLDALGDFDVDYAQGYAVARPTVGIEPIDEAVVATCRSGRQRLLRGSSVRHAAASTRDVYAVTAALATAGHRNDIAAAIGATAADLGVDVIGVSIVASGLNLREIASTGESLDTNVYSLIEYPATLAVIDGAGAMEVQVDDASSDPAERAVMLRLGHASLLLVPVHDGSRAIGVLEFAQRSPRRWNAQDIAHAQGLAEHLSPVLKRLGVGAVDGTRSAS
jgi:EAL domain-containing protein (putative c-di-GMP-specific phosphodiesterase class I)